MDIDVSLIGQDNDRGYNGLSLPLNYSNAYTYTWHFLMQYTCTL